LIEQDVAVRDIERFKVIGIGGQRANRRIAPPAMMR
jgi:hypothetical protein